MKIEFPTIYLKQVFSKMKIVFTPDWFLTSDVLIDSFSFVILMLLFSLAFRSYKMSKNKSSLYLGLGFFLMALAEVSIILTKFVLYYDTSITAQIGAAIVTYNVVSTVDIFYYIGFFFSRLLVLLGLYMIYKIPYDAKITKDFLIILYLIFVTALLSNSMYYFHHLTALIFLASIIDNYKRTYRETKMKTTKILILGFSVMALSQVIFIFSKFTYIYATAQMVQLLSYAILLALIIQIVQNGKKEKPSGNNPRHA